MADFSKMSDAELLSLVQPKAAAAPQSNYGQMSDEELMKLVQPQKPQFSHRGMILPFSSDEAGNVHFDSDAGIAGIAKGFWNAAKLPGQVMQEYSTPRTQMSDSDVSVMSVPSVMGLATAATPINPAARAGDAAIPGLMKAPMTVEKPPIPTTQALRDAADQGYKGAAEVPLDVSGAAVRDLSQGIQGTLQKRGFLEEFAPNTFTVLKKLNSPEGGIATGQNLESIRQALNVAARSPDKREAAAAGIAIENLDRFRSNIPAEAVLAGAPAASADAYRKAAGNYAAAMRSNRVTGELDNAYTGIVDRGELNAATANSGANVGNSIRQQAKILLKNRRDLRGFSDDEIGQLERVAEGTATGNSLRKIANLLGGGGGLGATVASGVTGGGAAAVTGNPWMLAAGIAAPAAGVAAKIAENASVQRQAKLLDEMIRQRSPLYQDALNAAPRNTLNDLYRSGALRAPFMAQPQQ